MESIADSAQQRTIEVNRGQLHREQPASFRRQLEAVKEAARIEQVVQDHGEFRLVGDGRLLGRCLSPDHEDKTPSMHIFAEAQTFKCFGIGCGVQGDVLDLVMLVEGCELWEAMMILATRYGIEPPTRPRSWFTKQERQAKTRAAIEETKKNIVRRRLFRHLILPLIDAIEDGDEHARELDRAWNEFRRLTS